MSKRPQQNLRSPAGFSMLEILIALLVVAIGVLGLAQLQGVATRQNHNAYLRSQAVILAYGITDRMRANQANLANYVIAMTDSKPTGTSISDQDLNAWLTALETLLPAGDGEITDSGNTYTITVQYDDSRGAEPPIQVAVETEMVNA